MRPETTNRTLKTLPIEDLDLSVSTWKLLKKNRIKTVSDLLALTQKRKWAVQLRCGRSSTLEIAASLSDWDLADTLDILLASGLSIRDLSRPLNQLAGMLLLCRTPRRTAVQYRS